MNVLFSYDAITDILNYTVEYGSVSGTSYVVTNGDDEDNGSSNGNNNSSDTTTTIIIVVACIIGVVLLVVIGWFIGKRLKNKDKDENGQLVEMRDTYDPPKNITQTTDDDQMKDTERVY